MNNGTGRDTRLDVLTSGTALVELTPGDTGSTLEEARVLQKLATGSAALFACALVRLGASAALLSATGDDELGAFFVSEMNRMKVDTRYVQRVPGQLTSLSLAAADGLGGKSFRFYRFPGYSDPLEKLDSAAVTDEALRRVRLFDFTESCIRQGGNLRRSIFDLARRSRSLGLEVCYAPNWRPVLWKEEEVGARRVQQEAVGLSDLLILNSEEARVISGQQDLHAAADALAALGPHTVAITNGGDRPAILRYCEGFAEVTPFQVPVHYDVGAGDTFHAGFLAAHLTGAGPVAAARFAAAAAAIRVSRPPELTMLAERPEVEALLRSRE